MTSAASPVGGTWLVGRDDRDDAAGRDGHDHRLGHAGVAVAVGAAAGTAEAPADGELAWFGEMFRRILAGIDRVLLGKSDHAAFAVVALVSEGHVLLEDVPGVGATTLARAIADTVGGTWNRIQFTPDLSGADVTGRAVEPRGRADGGFRPGPVFANVVIADELDRAAPRSLAALLEVMEERRVTVDGFTHHAPSPCVVVATTSPPGIDAGTSPLSPAQRDRFAVCLSLGYPDADDELQIATRHRAAPATLPVADLDDIVRMIAIGSTVRCPPAVAAYAVALVRATRDHPTVALGASPRASRALVRAARSMAAAAGRRDVTADDVDRLAAVVLAHRLLLTPAAVRRQLSAAAVIDELCATVRPAIIGASRDSRQRP